MITITTTPLDKAVFRCTFSEYSQAISYNSDTSFKYKKNSTHCQQCKKGLSANHCNLIQAALPILIYFSDLYSYEEVTVSYKYDKKASTFTDTAQRACLIYLIYGMSFSKCPLFMEIIPLLNLGQLQLNNNVIDYFLPTSTPPKKYAFNSKLTKINNLQDKIKRVTCEIEPSLNFLLTNARMNMSKDAAINSIATMISFCCLSHEF